MAEIRKRLAKLERAVKENTPERMPCHVCRDQFVTVFDDDPDNLWPYDANGLCPLCRNSPPGRDDYRLSIDFPELAEIFRGLPSPPDPSHRKLLRVEVILALLRDDNCAEFERIVHRTFENARTRLIE